MSTDVIHSNVIEDEEDVMDDDDEEEEETGDASGTEDDDDDDDDGDVSSDDDFEFKDLEMEIYGRLGGPPPELKEAIEKVAVVDSKIDTKKSRSDRPKTTKTDRDGSGRRINNHLQEITLSKNNKKVVDVTHTASTAAPIVMKESTTPNVEVGTTKASAEDDKREVLTAQKNAHNDKSVDKKIESSAKKNDEKEAAMNECGCIIM